MLFLVIDVIDILDIIATLLNWLPWPSAPHLRSFASRATRACTGRGPCGSLVGDIDSECGNKHREGPSWPWPLGW